MFTTLYRCARTAARHENGPAAQSRLAYPAQVAGLIFVDGSTPLQGRNPVFAHSMAEHIPSQREMLLEQAESALGMPRWRGECSQKFNGAYVPPSKLQAEDDCREAVAAYSGELENFDRSGEETVHTVKSIVVFC